MIVLKGCVRCKGDVHLRDDQHGKYLSCVQCGATVEARAATDSALIAEIA